MSTHCASGGALTCSTGRSPSLTSGRAASAPRRPWPPATRAATRAWKASLSSALDVEHEVVGALLRHAAGQLGDDRAVDQRHRDEQRQARAERQHDRARESAGRAEVADGQRQLGPARARQPPRDPGDGTAQADEDGEHAEHAEAVVEREQARLGGEDRQAPRAAGQRRAAAPGCAAAAARARAPPRRGTARRPAPARRARAATSVNSRETRKPYAAAVSRLRAREREIRLDRQGIANHPPSAPPGSAGPAPTPSTMPMPAINSTCSRCTPKIMRWWRRGS